MALATSAPCATAEPSAASCAVDARATLRCWRTRAPAHKRHAVSARNAMERASACRATPHATQAALVAAKTHAAAATASGRGEAVHAARAASAWTSASPLPW